MKCHNLLIDGRNALYRAIYAGVRDERFQKSGDDYFSILIRFLSHYFSSFNPEEVHVFWDDKSDNLWRKDLFPEYKATRDSSDIDSDLRRQYRLSLDIFRFLGFKQYFRKKQEADDLIYAFCRSFREDSIIISSDSDLKQIPFTMDYVRVYNPLSKLRKNRSVVVEETPTYDIVMAKALSGDKADNVAGYYKVGPVKSKQYAVNYEDRINFVSSEKAMIMENDIKKPIGDIILRRNRKLIDLGLCPDLLDNMMYVEKHRTTPAVYNYKTVVAKLRDNCVNGLIPEADKYIVPFSRLAEGD